jgi:hypothetical protein
MPLLLLLLFPLLVDCAERILISNQEPRVTRDHHRVSMSGGTFVPTRVPGHKCGWGDSENCFAYVTILYGENCSLPSPPPPCDLPSSTTYGQCGFSEGRITVTMSSDLSGSYWNEPIEILPAPSRPKGSYSRPKLLYNAGTRKYVLWVQYVPAPPGPQTPRYLVAVGGFGGKLDGEDWKVVHEAAPLGFSPSGVAYGEATLFLDPLDGAGVGYIVHGVGGPTTGSEGAAASSPAGAGVGGFMVERLNAEYTASLGATSSEEQSPVILPASGSSSSSVLGGGGHSVAMFKWGEFFYVAFGVGGGCCRCAEGSDTEVWASSSPLGPFTPAGTLGTLHGSQLDFILTHPDVEGVVYGGSRWGSGWGGKETWWGGLDDTPTFWGAIEFYRGGLEIGLPVARPLVWQDVWVLGVSTP